MNMSSVLFINRVYPPSGGATGQLLSELAPLLVDAGWNVTVLASRTGTKDGAADQMGTDSAGVRVERAGVASTRRSGLAWRLFGLLLLYPALLWRASRLPRPDVIVVMTDPPLLVFLGAVLRWWTGARLVHWVQDLYPEVAEELGVLRKGSAVARVLHGLSNWSLRRCDKVLVIGECMRARLKARGVLPGRLLVVPNWSPLPTSAPRTGAGQVFRETHGWRQRFVVMYSGNFGLAHEFETILDAAGQLQATHPSVLFVLVGEGPRRARLEAEVGKRNLTNVYFLPRQPKARLAECLSAAHIHLASMRSALCGLVVPSKVYGILAAGRPCLFLGPRDSEAARLIETHQCGSVLEDATGVGLAKTLVTWAEEPDRRAAVASRQHDLRLELSVEVAARAFQEVFAHVTGANIRPLTPSPDASAAAAPPDGRRELTSVPSELSPGP